MQRREFLKHGIAATALGGISQSFLFAGTNSIGNSAVTSLSIQLSDDLAMICYGDRILTDYSASILRKSPCFASIAGPVTGRSLISAVPQPWRQTSGVSFACDRVICGDANIDVHFGYGPRQLGQIVSQELMPGTCTATTAEFFNYCEWQRPDHRPIISDVRRFRLSLISETAYMLDCEYTLMPLTNLTVRPSGQSFFSLRAADDLAVSGGGHILNSLNTKRQQIMRDSSAGQAGWYSFFGKRGVPVEGIAVLSPFDAVSDSRWLTRDYGLLVPNSLHFRDSAWQLRKGETYQFAHRIVAYSGQPDRGMLNRLCDEFAKS